MDTRNQNTPNKPNNVTSEKEIKNHKEAAAHLESAAKHHLNAAKHYEEGNSEKAVECSSKAQECTDKAINGRETKPQINL